MLDRLRDRIVDFIHGSRSFDDQWAALKARRDEAWRDEEIAAATGKGLWIDRHDVGPLTNVADRLYRTADGSVHRAISLPLPHTPVAWYFPDQ